MVWLLIGALGVAISEEFGLSATQKGFMVAVPLLGGALLRIVVGPFADQFGARNVGLGLLVLEVVALSWGWLLSHSYTHILGTALLLGFAGASFAIALPIASQAYPTAHQGLAMGVAAIGNSGVLLATFFAPRMAELVGWRDTFGVMIFPVLLTAILFLLLVPARRPLPHGVQPPMSQWSVSVAALQPFMLWLSFLYGVTFGGFVGLSSFLPFFFHDQYGLGMVAAGTLTALCGLIGSIARPFGGHIADRLGGIWLLQVLFPIIAVVSLVLATLFPLTLTFPLTVGLVLLLGFGNGVIFQVASIRYHGMMGTASGFIGAGGGIVGFCIPTWFGVLKDWTQSYGSGFLAFSILSLVAGVMVVVAQRRIRPTVRESLEDSGV